MTIPCAMYKRGSYPGQIDHPGWLSQVVQTEAAYADALADGWSPTMSDPVVQAEPPVTSAESAPGDWRESTPPPRGRWRKVAE